jgi:hypothetical protein
MTKLEQMLYEALKESGDDNVCVDKTCTAPICVRYHAAIAAYDLAAAQEPQFGEPWTVRRSEAYRDWEYSIEDRYGSLVALARGNYVVRAVAAVNALAGRPTEEI